MVYEKQAEKKEEDPLKKNEWKCKECTYKNTIDFSKLTSSYCEMCNIKDKDVYDRIFYKKDGEKKMCRICYRNLEDNKCPKCYFMDISDF